LRLLKSIIDLRGRIGMVMSDKRSTKVNRIGKHIPTLLVLGIAIMLLLAVTIPASAQPPEPEYIDDFSTDTGLWTYWGNAYRDVGSGYVVLTQNVNSQAGILWLNDEFTNPFSIRFRYRAGGGTGADGFAFMFYKTKDYTPGGGGSFAFAPNLGSASGYGVEFDNYQNGLDPSANHIALIKDNVENHLAYVNDSRTEDNQWHQVKVTVGSNYVTVEVDGDHLITWVGEIDRTFGGIGFCAATGGLNNWHIIDDVHISVVLPPPPPNVKYLHCEDGLFNLTDPVDTQWDELIPIFGREYHLDSWEDNGDGILSYCDTIDMYEKPDGELRDYHVENVTITLLLTENRTGEPMYIELEGGFNETALTDPIGTQWHKIYPDFCTPYKLTAWDDGGELDYCDLILLTNNATGEETVCHVEEVAVDIVVTIKPPPVGGEAYPVNKASLLAPWIAAGIVLAGGISWYILRRRRAQN
jgi:hypothetical protein